MNSDTKSDFTSFSERLPTPYNPNTNILKLLSPLNLIPSQSPQFRCQQYIESLHEYKRNNASKEIDENDNVTFSLANEIGNRCAKNFEAPNRNNKRSPQVRCLQSMEYLYECNNPSEKIYPNDNVIFSSANEMVNRCTKNTKVPKRNNKLNDTGLSDSESLFDDLAAEKQVNTLYFSSSHNTRGPTFNISRTSTPNNKKRRKSNIFINCNITPKPFSLSECRDSGGIFDFDDDLDQSSLSVKKQLIIDKVNSMLSADDESLIDTILDVFKSHEENSLKVSQGSESRISNTKVSEQNMYTQKGKAKTTVVSLNTKQKEAEDEKKLNNASCKQQKRSTKKPKPTVLFSKWRNKQLSRENKLNTFKMKRNVDLQVVQTNDVNKSVNGDNMMSKDACAQVNSISKKRKRKEVSFDLRDNQSFNEKKEINASAEKENTNRNKVAMDVRRFSDRLRPNPKPRTPTLYQKYAAGILEDTEENRKIFGYRRPNRRQSVPLSVKSKARRLYTANTWISHLEDSVNNSKEIV